MFVSVSRVKDLTNYDVTPDLIERAQAIIEAYTGRLEVEVVDATDLILLERATAYQAAFMLNDPIRIFEQMSVAQLSQFGANITFGDLDAPFIARLAKLACNRLSWKRMRSVKTGSIYQTVPTEDRWLVE